MMTIVLSWEGRQLALQPNNTLLSVALAALGFGLFLFIGTVLAVVAGIGYVAVQLVLLLLGLVTAVLTSPLFLALVVPAVFIFVCIVVIWWCAKYLWCSLVLRKVVL